MLGRNGDFRVPMVTGRDAGRNTEGNLVEVEAIFRDLVERRQNRTGPMIQLTLTLDGQ
jgi:hypothetical protein